MTMRCDLHGINRGVNVEVRICGDRTRARPYEPFVILELRVEDSWVTLFLEPVQASEIAECIDRVLEPLLASYGPDTEAVEDKGGAL